MSGNCLKCQVNIVLGEINSEAFKISAPPFLFMVNDRKFTCLRSSYYCILGNIDQYRKTCV